MGFHEEKNVSHNCDLCGGDPQCVKICTYDALEYTEVEPIEWMIRIDKAEETPELHGELGERRCHTAGPATSSA